MDTTKPVTAVIVGGGHRAIIYGDYSLSHPGDLKIVGIADPNRDRCLMAAKRYGFSEEFCFPSADALAKKPRFADAVINGTMDHQHFETAAPLLEKGYDMLLEKPFSVNEEEMRRLLEIIHRNGNRVMICHVLRYAPFYTAIKKRLISGEIGKIINIQTNEFVSYHHTTNSYVRGKWADSSVCKTSMLLAKSCHDIDILTWLMSGDRPVTVSSVGSLMQFKAENAPAGAAKRCMPDCKYADSCIHSAKRIYYNHPDAWSCYVWADFENKENVTPDDKKKSLETTNQYGRCVYACDNNVVDHQSVLIGFASGATGTHNMTGGAARDLREVRITGTLGEIFGKMEDSELTVTHINPDTNEGFISEKIDLSGENTRGHGGGDENLTADFIDYIRNGKRSISCTDINDSVAGHLLVFLADKSREEGGAMQLCDFTPYGL